MKIFPCSFTAYLHEFGFIGSTLSCCFLFSVCMNPLSVHPLRNADLHISLHCYLHNAALCKITKTHALFFSLNYPQGYTNPRAPSRLNFVPWRLIPVGPQCGTAACHNSGARDFQLALDFWKICIPLTKFMPLLDN
jgi:hypothetical protein